MKKKVRYRYVDIENGAVVVERLLGDYDAGSGVFVYRKPNIIGQESWCDAEEVFTSPEKAAEDRAQFVEDEIVRLEDELAALRKEHALLTNPGVPIVR